MSATAQIKFMEARSLSNNCAGKLVPASMWEGNNEVDIQSILLQVQSRLDNR